jgi:serine/threonine protein kinase
MLRDAPYPTDVETRAPRTESDAARLARAEAVFHAARALAPEARADFVERAVEDPEQRRLVRALLEADGAPHALDHACARPEPDSLRGPAPDSIGPYRIVREIGAGGAGVVYEAEEQHPRRSVALKVLRLPHAELRRRFDREAQALASIAHLRIARV